jgi:hypothetical protein
MNLDDRPTIGERYASATESSDLRMRVEGGDVDVIIAAGLVPDGLATALYRLTVEYDAQRGPIDEARRWVAARTAQAALLRQEAEREASKATLDPEKVELLVAAAERMKRDAVAALRTEFLMALSAMKTLREARDRLWDFALDLAERKRMRLEGDALGHLTGRTLDAFLDPNCPHCDGRGSTGGGRHEHSGPPILCKPCRGLGSRRVDIGRTHAERLFAGALAMAMDASMYEVQRKIGRNRRKVTAAKELIAQALA